MKLQKTSHAKKKSKILSKKKEIGEGENKRGAHSFKESTLFVYKRRKKLKFVVGEKL